MALAVLAVVGVAMFLLTRELAASNASVRRRDAASWHATGRAALSEGHTERALLALRRAAHINRGDRDVALSLATALEAAGNNREAAAVLEDLRARQPDAADVNLELARLSTRDNRLPAAIRYYQDALDALWSPASIDERSAIRREFITVLTTRGERARALSQGLVYAAELPPTTASQMEAASLLLQLGDPARALSRYTGVLAAEPTNATALAGAGQAAFALGDYSVARRYLSQLTSPDDRLASMKRVAELVAALDPLAPRLGAGERERRLQQVLAHAGVRLSTCTADPALATAVTQLQEPPTPSARRPSHDAVTQADRFEEGLALAARVERETTSCRPPDEGGQAITIIARQRGLEEE
ncbi:MAG: tetratricopeptide repeat protein [Vicinamibacterales bacterium]